MAPNAPHAIESLRFNRMNCEIHQGNDAVPLISPALRTTTHRIGRLLLVVATTLIIVLLASNPELVPLIAVIDAVGLDVLILLLGAQLLATLPWVSAHLRRGFRLARRGLGALAAGAMGGYLRLRNRCR